MNPGELPTQMAFEAHHSRRAESRPVPIYEIRISSHSAKIFVPVLSAAVLVIVLATGSQRSITSTRTSTNSWPWVAGVSPR
jgi:hypothetical protein